jgi:hypothetical protein
MSSRYVRCAARCSIRATTLYPDQHPGASMPVPWTAKGVPAISFVDHLGEWLAKLFG